MATLDEPLVVDGLVIAEKGARADGRVVDLLEAGRVKGLAHLSLELTSLMLSDGQKVELRTARFEKEGPSSKTEDSQKVGIGAAIGAAIGAIAPAVKAQRSERHRAARPEEAWSRRRAANLQC